jgi:hypothetical protein
MVFALKQAEHIRNITLVSSLPKTKPNYWDINNRYHVLQQIKMLTAVNYRSQSLGL